jgi:hypothetical protein
VVKFRTLLIAGITFALTLVVASPDPVLAGTDVCTAFEISSGTCAADVDASINNGGVELGASTSHPGSGAPAEPSEPHGTGGTGVGTAGPGYHAPEIDGVPVWDGYTVTNPVTLADLVNFTPVPGVDRMEPNGWVIVGLDTNFYAVVATQVQDGELLGQAASVRFTPVRYHWSYGDGSGATLRTKGSSWVGQGVHEFDKTPTSHVYAKQGAYDIDLIIDFGAEYRYAGGGWVPIAGTIPVPANRLHASAGDAKTVLVQRECTRNPSGVGC